MSSSYDNISIYVHIPFCAQKCQYCDFNSYDSCNDLQESYFDALKLEIEHFSKSYKKTHESKSVVGRKVDSIFFGGGTPTFPDERFINSTLALILNSFDISDDCEITIESNPGTVDKESLYAYREAGFNRLSIGCQTKENRLLKTLGRIHTAEQFDEEFDNARRAGFANINVDLMFGLPYQTLGDFSTTLNQVLSLAPEHISTYGLIVEPQTPFKKLFDLQPEIFPCENLERQMYHEGQKTLENSNFEQYEISNFSKLEFECRHNISCWKYKEYIAFGAGGCTSVSADNCENRLRFANYSDIRDYISAVKYNEVSVDLQTIEVLTPEEQYNEFFMLGLRMLKGIDLHDFADCFGVSINPYALFEEKFERLRERGLITVKDERVKLTQSAIDIANQAFMEFV